MMGGKVNIRIIDTLFNSSNVVAVKSTAFTNYGSSDQISYTSIAFPPNLIPQTLKGAYNSPAGVSYKFNGGGELDGRNYTIDNQLVTNPPGTGTYAIWTKGTVNIPGNSASIGGTANGIDYPLSSSIDPNIVLQNQPYPVNYPINADQVMGGSAAGYSDGTLKAIAKSGVGGNQYIQTQNGSLPAYKLLFQESHISIGMEET
jgi:hypothetical protein